MQHTSSVNDRYRIRKVLANLSACERNCDCIHGEGSSGADSSHGCCCASRNTASLSTNSSLSTKRSDPCGTEVPLCSTSGTPFASTREEEGDEDEAEEEDGEVEVEVEEADLREKTTSRPPRVLHGGDGQEFVYRYTFCEKKWSCRATYVLHYIPTGLLSYESNKFSLETCTYVRTVMEHVIRIPHKCHIFFLNLLCARNFQSPVGIWDCNPRRVCNTLYLT